MDSDRLPWCQLASSDAPHTVAKLPLLDLFNEGIKTALDFCRKFPFRETVLEGGVESVLTSMKEAKVSFLDPFGVGRLDATPEELAGDGTGNAVADKRKDEAPASFYERITEPFDLEHVMDESIGAYVNVGTEKIHVNAFLGTLFGRGRISSDRIRRLIGLGPVPTNPTTPQSLRTVSGDDRLVARGDYFVAIVNFQAGRGLGTLPVPASASSSK